MNSGAGRLVTEMVVADYQTFLVVAERNYENIRNRLSLKKKIGIYSNVFRSVLLLIVGTRCGCLMPFMPLGAAWVWRCGGRALFLFLKKIELVSLISSLSLFLYYQLTLIKCLTGLACHHGQAQTLRHRRLTLGGFIIQFHQPEWINMSFEPLFIF